MSATRFQVYLENTNYGAVNPCIVDFDFTFPLALPVGDTAAQIVAYLAGVGDMGAGTSISQIRESVVPGAGSTPIPFPAAEYAALKAIVTGLPTLTAYGSTFGTSDLTALGTSILVNEYTTLVSRKGRGRHYRPWTNDAVITSAGQVDPAYVGTITDAYRALLLGQFTGGIFDPIAAGCQPVVHSATAGDNPVLNITVSTGPARLKTRTR